MINGVVKIGDGEVVTVQAGREKKVSLLELNGNGIPGRQFESNPFLGAFQRVERSPLSFPLPF